MLYQKLSLGGGGAGSKLQNFKNEFEIKKLVA